MVKIMMQHNSKEVKDFRDAMAKAFLGYTDESVIDLEATKAEWATTIAKAEATIDKYKNNEAKLLKGHTIESELEVVEAYKLQCAEECAVFEKHLAESKTAIAGAVALFSDAIIEAIRNAVKDGGIYSEEKQSALTDAYVDWFKANGYADVTVDDVAVYVRASYGAIRVRSTKAMVKAQTTDYATASKGAIVKLLVFAICNEPTFNKVIMPVARKWAHVYDKKAKAFVAAPVEEETKTEA